MSTFTFELFHFLIKQERFVTAGYQVNFVKSHFDHFASAIIKSTKKLLNLK